jgi:hypothetical protein
MKQVYLSNLRQYGAEDFRRLSEPRVVKDRRGVPLVVIVPYSLYEEVHLKLGGDALQLESFEDPA